jgi:hypothetical protein
MLTPTAQTTCYQFLNGDISLSDIEQFILGQQDLEQQLGSEIYTELILFDFKDKNAANRLRDFLFKYVVQEGQFETWKLKTLLQRFLTDPGHAHLHLQELYDLYCGTLQENGEYRYQYRFLAHLGLNHLHWLEEGYLRTTQGDAWKAAYEKGLEELPFYHQQLKPFAEEILSALESGDVQISDDGTYRISDDVKARLETAQVYRLRHPG